MIMEVCCFTNCFYIKPQLRCGHTLWSKCCFTNCFYIKPQLDGADYIVRSVALLIVSTSNRNTS